MSSSGTRDGSDGNVSNGYRIVESGGLDAAVKLVSGCPIVADGGKVHVFELMAM